LPAEDYLRFRRCSTATSGLKSLIAVGFEEYQILTMKYDEVFQGRLVVSLKDNQIYGESLKFLVTHLHQLEFIRMVRSKDAWKLTPRIIEDTNEFEIRWQ
jgi:hypothetical protein